VSRRRAPRPAGEALRSALQRAAPKTRLAAVQAVWEEVVGERLASAARPVSERDGTVTIACVDSVWADELDLMRGQLEGGLRERLGEEAPSALRFRVEDDFN
jgi:predicted nucleic acid-binding Zn ribbon protein